MDSGYDKVIEKISRTSGLDKEEIESRILAKQKKISGMISKEGAAQIVSAELGINLDDEKSKINEVISGMKKVNVLGKVITLFPVRTFLKNGQESKVVNIVVADETSNIKVVLWDSHHIGLIENGKVSEGSVIEILNGSARGNEIHLGSFSEMKMSNELFDKVITERIFKEKKISDLQVSDSFVTRAFIVQAFDPRFFNVCGECNKKANPEGDGFVCVQHGKVVPEKRCLMNIILDDGTGTVRAVLFHDTVPSLGVPNTGEISPEKKEEILGKEMFFSGNVRMNKFFNEPEVIIEEIKESNVDDLIAKLEN